MADESFLSGAVSLLRSAANPRKIILFGSRARNEGGPDSDFDLLIVENEVLDVAAEMVRLRRILSPLRIPVDLLVVSARQFEEWSDTPGNVLHEAVLDGKVLYEGA